MANKKVKINFDLDFTAKKTSIEEIRKQIELAVSALEMNIDDNSLKKMKKDLQAIGKIAEESFNKSTQQINLKKMGSMIGARDDLASIDTISKSLLQVGVNGTKSFNDIKNAGSFLNKSLTESNSILAKMGTTLMNTIRWNISASAVNAVTGEFKKMYYFAKDLDRALTDIRIVSGQSADQMERFALAANKSAQALGVSTIEYAQAATIFFQQGLGDADVKKMTDGAMVASRITGTAASDMADLLTSTMNGYKLAADEVMTVTDKLAAVGATTASNFQELATGMSKVASMANTAGVSVDELNAQLATIISVTRESPESIGTSLKTIYGRMLMFKTDTKALMKDEDGEVFGAPKVEEALQAYNKVSGAQISLFKTTADGRRELRDLGEVIEEIGDSWDDVTDRTAKFGLATALAGSRQQNRLVALFDSWDMYKNAVETSLNAEGTALQQNAIYMESYEGRLKGLQAAKEELYMVLTDTGSLKGFISMLTKGVELVSSLAKATGGFSAVVGILGASMSKTFATKFQGAGGLSGLIAGKGTDATTDAEIDAKNKLLAINKMLGAEEANRLRNNLKGAQDSQKAHQTMFQLMKKEAELIQEIARLEESKLTAASKEDRYDDMDDESKRLMEESTHLIALKAAYADLANAKLEGESLMQRAAAETGEVELAALDESFDEVVARIDDAQARIDNIRAQVPDIEERAQEHGRMAEFEEQRVEVASDELNRQFEESQRILQTQRAIQTTMMLLPPVISAATDETKSYLDMAQAGLMMLVPMIPAIVGGIMALPRAFAEAAAGASTFSVVMSTSLGPILAVVAAVAALGVAIKVVDNLTVTLKEQKAIAQEISDEIRGLESEYKSLESKENRTADEEAYLKLLEKEKDKKEALLKIETARLIQQEFFAKKEIGRHGGNIYYTDSGTDKIKKDMEELANLQNQMNQALADGDLSTYDELNEKVLSLEISLMDSLKTMTDYANKVGGDVPEEFNTLRKSLESLLLKEDDLKKSTEELVDTYVNSKEILEGLTKEFDEVTGKIQKYYKILNELNSKEGLSAQSKQDIITKYQELLPYIDNEKELREQLIRIIKREEEVQLQAYKDMLMYNEDFFNAKLKGNKELVDKLGEYYDEDLENAKTLAKAKEMVEERLMKNISKHWAKFYKVSAIAGEGYVQTLGDRGVIDEFGRNIGDVLYDEMRKVSSLFDDIVNDFSPSDFKDINMSGIKEKKGTENNRQFLETIDAEIRAIKLKNDSLLKTEKSLQEQLKLAKDIEGIEGLNEQYRITGELIEHNKIMLQSFKDEQDLVHARAKTIREDNSKYDTKDWFDANAEATTAFIQQQNDLIEAINNAKDDSTKKSLESQLNEMNLVFDQIQKLKKAWMESNEEVKKMEDVIKDLGRELEKHPDKVRNIVKELIELEKRNAYLKLELDEREARDKLKKLKKELDEFINGKDGKSGKQGEIDALQSEIDAIQESERARSENMERAKRLEELSKLQNQYYHLQYTNLASISEEQAKLVGLEKEREQYLERQTKLQELQLKLSKLQNEKNIQQLTKNKDGTWDFKYVADQKAIEDVNKQVEDLQKEHEKSIKDLKDKTLEDLKKAQESYNEWEYQNGIQRSIREKQQRIKDYQDEIKDLQKKYTDRENAINEAFATEKENLDRHYMDIDKLTDEALKTLNITFDGKWIEIGKTLQGHFDTIGSAYDELVEKLSTPLPTPKMPKMPNIDGGSSSGKTIIGRIDLAAGGLRSVLNKFGGSFASGGEIASSGLMLTEFHGKKNDPEWIFNSDQLQKVLKSAVLSTVRSVTPTIPKIALASASGGGISQSISVDKLVFPNVKDAKEIEGAIKSLSTYANQWANRK